MLNSYMMQQRDIQQLSTTNVRYYYSVQNELYSISSNSNNNKVVVGVVVLAVFSLLSQQVNLVYDQS